MTSLYGSARPSQSILGFHHQSFRPNSLTVKVINLSPNLHFTPLNFRFKNASRLPIRQRLLSLCASNNPSEGSLPKKPEETKTEASSSTQGPPFLTILAGFVVLFIVFWIVKSIVLWLISLVFTFPASK